ncbi:MAG: iron chelate uptake ABC transporter family permease subunit, partial [Pseudomonadota bacterium]
VFAGGVVIVSVFRNYIHIDLMHFIMGDVLAIADTDLWGSAITAALVLSTLILFFRHFQLTSFDPVMAASIGMPVVLLDYILTINVSLVVVSAVSMVGVILVVGLLITPAATAYLLSDRLDRMMLLSALFGLTSVIGGLYVSVWIDSAGGGAVMLFCTFQFLVVLFVAPRYGLLARWVRLHRLVPQELVEDILLAVLRHEGQVLTQPEIKPHVHDSERLGKALASLTSQGLLSPVKSGVSLTETGKTEARRILRAHRLWETYLKHVGAPDEELHPKAHELEHIHDPETYAYLDDLLDHPPRDPHGQEIPLDQDLIDSGRPFSISLLRPGRQAMIEAVPAQAADTGLMAGDLIRMGARQNQGQTWVVITEKDRQILLNHTQADAVLVRPV